MKGQKAIPLARPLLDDREEKIIKKVLSSGRLVRGPFAREFEKRIRQLVGVKYAISMNSGTSALFSILKSIGIKSGDEVLAPALTFPAAVETIVMLGARAVFVDVDENEFNITPEGIRQKISERTKCLITVDLFGVPCRYDEIKKILKSSKRKIFLIEDAACAIGSSFNGRMCGSFGDASILSFHPRKVITTGEGGMVLTNKTYIAKEVEMLKNHGISRSGSFVKAGLNLRMGEIEAAMGIMQLEKLSSIISKRKKLFARYAKRIGSYFKLQHSPDRSNINFQTLCVILPIKRGKRERIRNSIIEGMKSKGIELQVASYCVPMLPAYKKWADGSDFPNARLIHSCGIALPLHNHLSLSDVDYVCKSLLDLCKQTSIV